MSSTRFPLATPAPSETAGDVSETRNLVDRARLSLGASSSAVYAMVAARLDAHDIRGGRLLDAGCGGGALWRVVRHRFTECWGLDAVRYDGLPADVEFRQVDLDAPGWPPVPASDVVAAVETIEHLENPWAFMRQLAAHTTPGGWVLVTTPNQLSVLSLGTLLSKQRFSAFQDAHYPAHRTALLESDLRRAVVAARLEPIEVAYSLSGRLPLTGWHYRRSIADTFPRALSDNLIIVARKPRRP
jgi:2-polyprenyl-3-methyl-5-hydroxy-6-metoxy-1,4-benzoquinol methylase